MNVENSKAIENSSGVNCSNGVNCSDGVNCSKGVNWSKGVSSSNVVNESYGVHRSYGVNRSYGILNSYGVNESYGVNWSYGILNSYGVDKALFLADKKRTFSIFGKDVTEQRFDEIWGVLHNKLNGWYPKFNNAFELYIKAGNDWKKVKISDITSTLDDWEEPYEAWKDMPEDAIEYIKSLEEFDAKMFKRITGIDVEVKEEKPISLSGKTVKVTLDGVEYEAVIK